MILEQLTKDVEEKLKDHPERLNHVKGVLDTATKLANHYKVEVLPVQIAAIFHDYAKYDTIQDQIRYIDLKQVKRYSETPVIYHALAGAALLEYKYNYKDKDVLSAIRKHVWGDLTMNMIDKIVLISDKIEPSRTYEKVEHFRKLAFENIDQAIYEFLLDNIEYNKSKNFVIHEEQYQIVDMLKEQLNEEN